MKSRFRCMKSGKCLRCGGCCKIREGRILDEKDDLELRRRIYDKIGILYIYPMSRYTISLTAEEKDILQRAARLREIELRIIPKKIKFLEGEHIVIDWSLDHDICPFYNDKIGCTIYESRPAVCKSFPETHKFDIDIKKDDALGFDEALEEAADNM